ncbi:Ig-like domain repeat protein [Methanosphaera sp.]
MKHKNMKHLFLLVTLVFLLVGLTAISAADTSSNTTDVSTSDIDSLSADSSLSTDVQSVETSDNKNTQKATKTIKSEGESVNLYVSDSTGSDDNDGSSDTTPFKTIEKAISSTTDSGVYNIHIAEGVYKGFGNTNLTVYGTNNINFIGSGINKTVFDGEANYTIQEEGYYWGSSSVWKNYVNYTGNWFMNITEGSGSITITNMTFQNGWVTGGSSTSAYKIAPIDNYATLSVDNVYFYSNHCGVASALRNRPGATLTVNNSVFDSNSKSDSTGNAGIIYNNGTAYVYNSLFTDNYARWGSVTNDRDLSVINCTFRNGIAYDGGSGFKSGTGIYMNTGSLDFFTVYDVDDIQTLVENCTFENNQQCDIHIGFGQATIRENTFNQSTGIYEVSAARSARVNLTVTHLIANNTFINMQPSTLLATLITSETPSFAFYSTALGYNTTIINNTIDVPDNEFGYALRLTGYANVINNTMNNYIFIYGNNNTITGNTINVTKDYTVYESGVRSNNIIANNTLITDILKGDLSVSMGTPRNIVENNTPISDVITVTNDNYTTYFNDDGTVKAISNGTKVILSGEIINKTFLFDNIKLRVISENTNATLINSTIVIRNNAKIILEKIKINNTDSLTDYAILLNSTGNKILNSEIIVNTNNTIKAVIIDADENTIQSTKITVNGPSFDVDWSGYPVGLGKTIGLLIRSSNNLINGSTINVTSQGNGTEYGSVYGVEIQSPIATQTVSGNRLTNNRLYTTGDKYAYSLNMVRADNTNITSTTLNAKSNFIAYAMQLSGPAKNNAFTGTIWATAPTAAYGAYVTGQWSGVITNTTFVDYYIREVNSLNAYGIVLEGVSNTSISTEAYNVGNYATITTKGTEGIPIQLTYADNTNIHELGIKQDATSETSQFILITNSTNVVVNNNSINATYGNGISIVNSSNVNVTENYLNINNIIGGNDAVTSTDSSNIIIELNKPGIIVLTDDTYSTYFDENSKLRENISVDLIKLGGDLYNKDLIFNKSIVMTNIENYTIYNGTIFFEGNISGISNLTQININNVNKSAIITNLTNTAVSNIYVTNGNMTVVGDNITAIISPYNTGSNELYLYLLYENITVIGKNATYVNFTGYLTGSLSKGMIRTENSNINVSAEDTSIVYNINSTQIYFTKNNVTQTGKNIVTILSDNGQFGSQGFYQNNVFASGENVSAIYAINNTAVGTYIRYNNLTLTSNNPITAITLKGMIVQVNYNNITVNTYNGETPIISLAYNISVQVTDNYIVSYDVCGNNAVNQTGITIRSNTPNYLPVNITLKDNTLVINQENNITAIITDMGGKINMEGTVTFTDAEGNVLGTSTINDGIATITYTLTKAEDKIITISYEGNDVYAQSSVDEVITVTKVPTTITVDPITARIGDVITFTATVTQGENTITNGKLIFKVNGKTLRDANGNVIYATVKDGKFVVENVEVLAGWAKDGSVITAVYGGYGDLGSSRVNTSITVTKRDATTTMSNITAKAGEIITLTVQVTDDVTVNGGKVVFKLNGKTLRDDNGDVIYATVNNGVATVTYTLPVNMSAKNYTITSVFSSSNYNRVETKATLTVTK